MSGGGEFGQMRSDTAGAAVGGGKPYSYCHGTASWEIPMPLNGADLLESVRATGSGAAPSARSQRASAHIGAENQAPYLGGGLSAAAGRKGAARYPGDARGAFGPAARAPANPPTARPTGARVTSSGGGGGALNDITNVSNVSRPVGKKPATLAPAHAPAGVAAVVPPAPFAAPPVAPAPAAATARPQLALVPAAGLEDGDPGDPQSVAEYVPDIYAQLFRTESQFLPRPNYMQDDWQMDINHKMRAILVDWLVEVHMKYRLRKETLFLTVNLIDRYLSRAPVMRRKLQLLGVVSMFIAAKYEEIHPPKVSEFAYITDNTYDKEEILTFECRVLEKLSFQIAVPTQAHFLDRLQKMNNCDETHREVSSYILELGLLEMKMLHYTPSHLVSAALLVSNELLNRRPAWPASMVHHSRHSEQALRECAEELWQLLNAAPGNSLQAVRKKYCLDQHRAVALMTFLLPA
mmetsp:Transcript_13364/g.35310  ORF Transcript_13364/g.35310 Transcript_13364/m.35310 type:complete len:464 (+) Transcript_13364:86-1477(+)